MSWPVPMERLTSAQAIETGVARSFLRTTALCDWSRQHRTTTAFGVRRPTAGRVRCALSRARLRNGGGGGDLRVYSRCFIRFRTSFWPIDPAPRRARRMRRIATQRATTARISMTLSPRLRSIIRSWRHYPMREETIKSSGALGPRRRSNSLQWHAQSCKTACQPPRFIRRAG